MPGTVSSAACPSAVIVAAMVTLPGLLSHPLERVGEALGQGRRRLLLLLLPGVSETSPFLGSLLEHLEEHQVTMAMAPGGMVLGVPSNIRSPFGVA